MFVINFHSEKQMMHYSIIATGIQQEEVLKSLNIKEKGYLDSKDFEVLRENNIHVKYIADEAMMYIRRM